MLNVVHLITVSTEKAMTMESKQQTFRWNQDLQTVHKKVQRSMEFSHVSIIW